MTFGAQLDAGRDGGFVWDAGGGSTGSVGLQDDGDEWRGVCERRFASDGLTVRAQSTDVYDARFRLLELARRLAIGRRYGNACPHNKMATIDRSQRTSDAADSAVFVRLPAGVGDDGAVEHALRSRVGGNAYPARLLKHNLFQLQSLQDTRLDGAAQVTVTLANADSHFSEIERETGFPRRAGHDLHFCFTTWWRMRRLRKRA